MNRFLIKYGFLSVVFMWLLGCKCPQLAAPTIYVNSDHPYVGTTLILATESLKNTSVYWTGPLGTHVGDSWVIPNVTDNTTGTYIAKYIYKRRKKCVSANAVQVISAKECTKPNPPIIVSSADQINEGSTLILTVPSIPDFYTNWIGPNGNFKGDSWVIENVSKEMSGTYSAQYINKVIDGCKSDESKKDIQVLNKERNIVVKYNNISYFVDFVQTDNSTTVWFRADKIQNIPSKDFPVMTLSYGMLPGETVKEDICRNTAYFEQSKFLTGCLAATGAAGCTLAIGTGNLEVVPFCAVFLEVAEPALIECIHDISGKLAEKAGEDIPFLAADLVKAGVKLEGVGVLEGTIQIACLDKNGDRPLIKDGQLQLNGGQVQAAPHPTPPAQSPQKPPAQSPQKPGANPNNNKPNGERNGHIGDNGDRPVGDKPADKPAADKPVEEKPVEEKPAGDKPAGDKPAGGDKPQTMTGDAKDNGTEASMILSHKRKHHKHKIHSKPYQRPVKPTH